MNHTTRMSHWWQSRVKHVPTDYDKILAKFDKYFLILPMMYSQVIETIIKAIVAQI